MASVETISELGAGVRVRSDLGCWLPPPGHLFDWVLVEKALAGQCNALCWLMAGVRNAETLACKSDPMLSEDIGRAFNGCSDREVEPEFIGTCRAHSVGDREMPSEQACPRSYV